VRWKASRSGPVGLFSVTAQSATDKLISTLVANTQEPGSDVSYVHGKQGRFYIEVTAAAMNWEITVEEK
jgi:hypothetical protein